MIRSYEDLTATADAYTDSRALLTGVELEVFTHLGRRTATASEIARAATTSREGMERLLNALTGMGLLSKRGTRYRNTHLSRTYLDSGSSRSITNYLGLAGQHWEDWMHLTNTIRKGRVRKRAETPDDPVFRKCFARALHERSFYLIPRLLKHIHLGHARSLLDLGGGSGSYAFALVRKTPGLHATIFDRHAAIQVASAEARKAGLAHRVDVIGGDLFTNDYGGPYDAVLYSNVIHIYNPGENRKVIHRIRKALKPGGQLIVVDFFLENDRAHPHNVSSFALMMYLFTDTGHCYTWDEVTHWLKQAGFSRFCRARVTDTVGILQGTLNAPQRRQR